MARGQADWESSCLKLGLLVSWSDKRFRPVAEVNLCLGMLVAWAWTAGPMASQSPQLAPIQARHEENAAQEQLKRDISEIQKKLDAQTSLVAAMSQRLQNLERGQSRQQKILESLEPKDAKTTPKPAPVFDEPVIASKTRVQRRCESQDEVPIVGCPTARTMRCNMSYDKAVGHTKCPGEHAWAERMVKADPNPAPWLTHSHESGPRIRSSSTWAVTKAMTRSPGCNALTKAAFGISPSGPSRWKNMAAPFVARCNVKETHSACRGSLNPRIPKPPKFESTKGPRAVCIEGLISTCNALNVSRSELGFDAPDSASGILHIVNAAVSDQALPGQTVQFLDVMPGSEMGVMVAPKDKRPTVSVPLATVDGIVAQLQLPRVDILLVDTEGADPLVLRGANKSLDSVRYIMFETHRDKPLATKTNHVNSGQFVRRLL